MKLAFPLLRSFAVVVLSLPAWGADAPSAAPAPRDAGTTALDKLAGSVDRLVGLLEKEMALRTDERDTRRIEVALGVLELRYKKIDRLESEIQQSNRDEEETSTQLDVMKARADQLRKGLESQDGVPSAQIKDELAVLEIRIKSEEDRLTRMRERRSVLQNDLASERHRLASIEATLDAWLDKQ